MTFSCKGPIDLKTAANCLVFPQDQLYINSIDVKGSTNFTFSEIKSIAPSPLPLLNNYENLFDLTEG